MRLAITGLGLVSPFGVGADAFFEGLAKPETIRAEVFRTPSEALAESEELAAEACTAEAWGFNAAEHLGPKGHRSYDRLTKFLIAAARGALGDAELKQEDQWRRLSGARVGISSATAYGSLDAITELNRIAELEDPRYINPTRFPNTVINAAAGYVSIWEDLRAPNTTIVDGNCGALDAVLNAETHLVHDRGDAFLVGGGEVITEPLYRALRKLEVLRDAKLIREDEGGGRFVDGAGKAEGIELGEGACYLVVERPRAEGEPARPCYGEILGYGTAFEPPEREAVLVFTSPEAIIRAVEEALRDGGLEASDIDAVVSARCGLDTVDGAEAEALAQLFDAKIPVAAPKRLHGETFGAAGAFGMVAAIGWMRGLPITPRISGEAPTEPPTHVLVLAVGLYGNVSAVVLRAPREGQPVKGR